jgi:hypothetical protein
MRCAMEKSARSPLRFVAPVVLIVAAIVFFAVLSGSLGGDDGSGTEDAAVEMPAGPPDEGASNGDGGGGGGGGQEESYEVQEGDTLDGIAVETGVSAEEILELNPSLDSQSLPAGEEIQISE